MSRICPPASRMEITQQVRECAAKQGLDTEESVEASLTQKSDDFSEAGGEIYS